jgi:hypothetical protein
MAGPKMEGNHGLIRRLEALYWEEAGGVVCGMLLKRDLILS